MGWPPSHKGDYFTRLADLAEGAYIPNSSPLQPSLTSFKKESLGKPKDDRRGKNEDARGRF